MLNIIPRRLVVAFLSIAFSASSSTATAGARDPHPDGTPNMHEPTTISPPPIAEANPSALVAGKQIPHEEKRSADKLKNDIIAGENSIYFLFGKTKIDDIGTMVLRRNATRLKENPLQVATLVAFTEYLGSRSYGLAVAEERINIVASALRALGVPRKQFRRKSARLGKFSSACNTAACGQLTRKVELVY